MSKAIQIPVTALFVLHVLQKAGFEAAIVGGAVRDLLLIDRRHVDFDFATNAQPEQIQALLPHSFYENDFGTVSIDQHSLAQLMVDQQLIAPDKIKKISINPVQTVDARSKIIDVQTATKLHISLAAGVDSDTNNEAAPASETTPQLLYEITTYRSQELYENGYRRPSSFSWGQSLEEDLQRRDFTINALAIKVSNDELLSIFKSHSFEEPSVVLSLDQYELVDQFDGLKDLAEFKIKTVGLASDRFQEDALRMLRAVRFSVQLNFQIEDETRQAIVQHSALMKEVSWERIRNEFLKILASAYPAEGVELLDQVGLLPYILPELIEAKGVEQGGHHTTDVWTHSLDALRTCPSPDPIVRLATLLHDIAKPQTFRRLSNGNITFYNHEVIGARVARDVARRLRLSKDDVDRIFTLVRHHMFYYQPHNTDAAIRRFMRKVGLMYVDDILDLREADRLGSGARKTSWRLEEMKQRMIEQLNQPMAVTDLAINGTDLMTELGLQPGPQIGQILQHLFEIVLENPEMNTREILLEKARAVLKN
jgi:tRNA nucleotidyltransferase (CCA-adding enzyme)